MTKIENFLLVNQAHFERKLQILYVNRSKSDRSISDKIKLANVEKVLPDVQTPSVRKTQMQYQCEKC